jgi:hypothetical protein
MNTFWLKVAGAVVLVVVVIIIISAIMPSGDNNEPQPKPGKKTIYDTAEQDRQKFLRDPEPVDSSQNNIPAPEPNDKTDNSGTLSPAPPAPEPETLYFKPLNEIEKIEAERLLNVAVPGRSIGRLPTTGFKLMVDPCRQIIRRWPESSYAYQAKLMLADIPERFRTRYNITDEEMDVSAFRKQRPGTQPYKYKDLK